MEDKGAYVFFNKFRWLFVGFIIIAIVLIGIYFFEKIKNENNLKNYLKENGYEYEGQTYFKTINEKNDQTISNINYIFSIKANNFSKSIETGSDLSIENIELKYNGSDILNISFHAESYTPIASISQSASYNMDNGEYTCKLVSRKGEIKSQCPKIKKEAKKFAKEINTMLDDANINKLFITKNSDDI